MVWCLAYGILGDRAFQEESMLVDICEYKELAKIMNVFIMGLELLSVLAHLERAI